MDEAALAGRLIAYNTATIDGLRSAGAFVEAWLAEQGIEATAIDFDGRPVITAQAGAPADSGKPTVIFHGHVDVVPAPAHQFEPQVEGDRLLGRGAYDMKGALAAMMFALTDIAAQDAVTVKFVCVPDEESDDVTRRSTDELVAGGLTGDFAITGEPTDLHIGVEAKGVLALRLALAGIAAHGSTPWLGDNAIIKAHDAFRRIETLPFSRESSDLFMRPSINLARIQGGDAFNKVPDLCQIDVDIRFLPEQDPQGIIEQIRGIGDLEIVNSFVREPAVVSREDPYVVALRDAVERSIEGDALSVGRDGASDAVSFLRAGIPAVEFGPVGGGHHGPGEWVSRASLPRYRQALGDFIRLLPGQLSAQPAAPEHV